LVIGFGLLTKSFLAFEPQAVQTSTKVHSELYEQSCGREKQTHSTNVITYLGARSHYARLSLRNHW